MFKRKRVKVMSEQSSNLEDAIRWLRDEVSVCAFGEVALKATMHSGRIVRIEKTITTKLASNSSSGGNKK